MQKADQQPCLEPVRTMHPVMVRKAATLDPSFQSVLSSYSKPFTSLSSGWHMLQGCWGQDVASQLLPADRHALRNLSGLISLTTLVCLAHRSSVVPYQAKEQHFGQEGCKVKAENPNPRPHPRVSLNKLLFTVKCIKKANTFLFKANTRSITELPMSQHKEKLFFRGFLPLNYWLAM